MIEDLIEAILPLFKLSGGFTEILYLLLLLAVLVFLVLDSLQGGYSRPKIFGAAGATPPSR
jgi:hypothetical protein